MSYEYLLVEQDEQGILTITLNRPQVRNALNTAAVLELLKVFREEAQSPMVRCVILTGSGAGFCAGQDLEERKAFAYPPAGGGSKPAVGESLRQRYNPLIILIRELPKPVIAAVNGVAAGIGCSLALACDMRVAAESAIFVESFAKVGLSLDGGSSYFLPRLIGTAKAFELALTGDQLKAAEAERLGLVNRVVPNDKLLEETYALARKLCANAPQALGRVKQVLNYGHNATLSEALEFEAEIQQDAVNGPEYTEGLRAFFEKRPPKF
jgi:2-(1,2-epoxy-1,2-dihydrophenyl)acetyl-CoA isomerase